MPAKKDQEIPKDIAKLTFEQALAELERIVGRLESGDVDLEDSIEAYTRGTQLKAHCEAKLQAAQARVDQIKIAGDGTVSAEAAEIE